MFLFSYEIESLEQPNWDELNMVNSNFKLCVPNEECDSLENDN